MYSDTPAPPEMLKRTELSSQLLGVAATNAFFMHDSSSRLQMYCSHIGQSLGVKGATVQRLQTGVEREYAKYTFNIKMPANAIILKILQKYPMTIGFDSIRENPLTYIIYEDTDSPTREIGIVELPSFHCIHQYYGFKYVPKPVLGRLTVNSHIPKDTVLADSPLVTPTGDYKFGLMTNVAMMSLQLNTEDGVVISRSMAKRLTTVGFGSRVVSWGKHRYPLNLKGYGTKDRYKPFPDIGDRVRPDGLLMVLREYDEFLAVTDMTTDALQTPDYNFDKPFYAEPGAKVIDIIIHEGSQLRSKLPSGMSDQCEKYMSRTKVFYKSLLDEYESLRRRRGGHISISPEFHALLVTANAMCNEDPKNRVIHTSNRNPVDEWNVEIVYEYEMVPDIGAKITDCHGGKGVIVEIWDDERMPVDKWGNRAEVIVDDQSTIKRMNIGRLYEQYINAAGSYLTNELLPVVLGKQSPQEIENAWQALMEFYNVVSPVMADMVRRSDVPTRKVDHIKEVIRDGHYIHMPTDTPVCYLDVVRQLNQMYPDLIGPVSYIGNSGQRVTTKSKILIGGLYMLLLEKTGNTWAAVASSKLQHFGIPAKLTNEDKYSAPGRAQPVRILGESEVRLFAAVVGGNTVADLLDQTNNPQVHRAILDTILHSKQPTNIQRVVDRVKYPMGFGRMHLYVNHFAMCAGWRFARRGKVNVNS